MVGWWSLRLHATALHVASQQAHAIGHPLENLPHQLPQRSELSSSLDFTEILPTLVGGERASSALLAQVPNLNIRQKSGSSEPDFGSTHQDSRQNLCYIYIYSLHITHDVHNQVNGAHNKHAKHTTNPIPICSSHAKSPPVESNSRSLLISDS